VHSSSGQPARNILGGFGALEKNEGGCPVGKRHNHPGKLAQDQVILTSKTGVTRPYGEYVGDGCDVCDDVAHVWQQVELELELESVPWPPHFEPKGSRLKTELLWP
jgi:hypothetical protein